jgi:energy-coupling factor transport system permease protein
MARTPIDIAIGGYVPGNSLLHRLDPRTKLLGLCVLLIGVFVGHSLVAAAVGASCALFLALLSAAGWKIWFAAMSRFRWMLLLTAGINLLAGPGDTPVLLGGRVLPFTVEAMSASVLLTVQLITAIAFSMALTFSTTPHELTKGCERLACPLKRLKVPVDDIALVVFMAMRFIPLFQQELRTIVDAHKARGVDFHRGSIAARAQNLLPVLVPAVLGTLRRGDRLAEAMAGRGFRPGEPRTEFNPLRFCGRDWAGLGISLGFLCLSYILTT